MSELQSRVVELFEAHYGAFPEWVVRAPGRVNLIGEHPDYNDGFMLPMAIDRAIWIALRPRTDSTVRVHSLDFDEVGAFDLERFEKRGDHWTEYLKGTAWVLQEANYPLRGWDGVMAGNVPIRAGLSSSAALELATARAFLAIDGRVWDPEEVARHCQRAENEWVGVNCGIMDQMASARGVAGYALLIDCRALHAEPVPVPPDTAVVIMDTTVRRGLADSAYNERRRQCEAAARFFDETTHPLQTSRATGAGSAHLGPCAQALALMPRECRGRTIRRVCKILEDGSGLDLSPGGLTHMIQCCGSDGGRRGSAFGSSPLGQRRGHSRRWG